MFNDEMQSIRWLAVESLANIGSLSLVKVTESQLMYILTAFNDTSVKVRQSAFKLLR